MDKSRIVVYGKDVKAPEFKLPSYTGLFTQGHAILELFHENLFCELSRVPVGIEPYLVSARLFCEDKNIKIRRLNDNTFRMASDFEIDGFASVWEKRLFVRKTRILLWGYVNEELKDYLYEERIPYLFDYSEKALDLNKGDRLTLAVNGYLDDLGNILWSRFLKICKWEKIDGKGEKGGTA